MRRRWRAWCMDNTVLPLVLLISGNNTTDPQPACHAPPPPDETTLLQPMLSWLEDHWFALLLVTLAIVASLGLYLAVHHRRWRRTLDAQLERGVLTEEEHRRLR